MKIKKILFLLVLSGCSLFEPREAQPPGTGSSGRFVQPDRPEIVFENLQNAIAFLNVQNFLACLDPAFEYTPAQTNSTTDPDLWRNWGKDQEQLWFNTIRSAATVQSGHQLQLETFQTENLGPTLIRFSVPYALTISHNRTASGVPSVASGTMIVTVSSGASGLWAITQWTDLASEGGFSWSDLRSAFIRG